MKYKLDEIVEVTMGQSPQSKYYNTEGKGTPFLQGNRTFGFKRPTFDTYTTLVTKEAKAGDVIMSVRAPVGDLNITPVDMCLGRGVCSLRMKNGNQEFLYYMMKYYMPQLLNKESGTVFGSVNRNDINGLDVDIPEDTEKQKKIARYLTMLDEKIELNNEINNNLLEQALHSNKLYQIYTYVKNLDKERTGNVSGMLLYARTDEVVLPNSSYKMGGNKISVDTLNLDCDFEEIRKQLNEIVIEHFGSDIVGC